jgi:hypothetical protein
MWRLLLFSLFLIVLTACGRLDSLLNPPSVADETPSSPNFEAPEGLVGEFSCMGHEFGLLAFAGRLVLNEGGDAALYWMDAGPAVEGNWSYDRSTDRVTFSDEMEISHGEFDPQTTSLQVYLREGVERVHVELGVMTCQPQE